MTTSAISAHGAAEKFGFARAATDPKMAFEDEDVATIFIATRHDSHAELAIAALHAGKNVFVEKPLALNREELASVIDAASAAPGLLTVGFNRRFAPMVLEAKAALGPAPGPLVMTYRINAGPIPSDHWVHGDHGGGRIAGEVCHFVDTLTALAGAAPVAVEGFSPAGIGDSLAALLRFADGSVGTIVYSSVGDPAVPKERIDVFAAGTIVEIDDFRMIAVSRNGRTRTRKAAKDKGQNKLVAAFLAATRGEAEPPISIDELEAVSLATLELAGL